MARIGFFPVFDAKSHVNATLGIAKALRERGHDVIYWSSLDFEHHIRAQGFEYKAFCPALVPEGHYQRMLFDPGAWRPVRKKLYEMLINGELDDELVENQLDLLLVDPYIQEIALLAYKLGVPTALLSPTLSRTRYSWVPPIKTAMLSHPSYSKLRLRLWWYGYYFRRARRYSSQVRRGLPKTPLEKLVEAVRYPRRHLDTRSPYPVLTLIPELILCPAAFDFPIVREKYRHIHYVGPYVDVHRNDNLPFPWERIKANKHLIYCSLGTAGFRWMGGQAFLQTIIDAMVSRKDWQLVMAVGEHLDVHDFHSVPSNVVLVNKAPQLEILRRASLLITHGGLNSIKESIMHGVPMIAVPWHPHPMDAVRVVYHGMGLMEEDVESVTIPRLHAMIDAVGGDPAFRQRTELMRRRFVEVEESGIGVRLVEQLLETAPRKPRVSWR